MAPMPPKRHKQDVYPPQESFGLRNEFKKS